jgi:hypothetical protein
MPIAKRDTYGTETVYGVEVTRFVREGDEIPAGLDVPDADVEDPDQPAATETKAKK